MRYLRHEDERQPSAPAWALPYGDLMSLLLACFVLLVSMGEIRQDKKFQAMADSLQQRFGQGCAADGGSPQYGTNHSAGAALGRTRRLEAIEAIGRVRPPQSDANDRLP
jgi:chemotaxis protein MotB